MTELIPVTDSYPISGSAKIVITGELRPHPCLHRLSQSFSGAKPAGGLLSLSFGEGVERSETGEDETKEGTMPSIAFVDFNEEIYGHNFYKPLKEPQ